MTAAGAHFAFAPRSDRDRPLRLEADYVVVGSGAGGASAAVTLARGGASVIVVEAGAWRDPEDYPSSMHGSLRDMMDSWGLTMTQGKAIWPIVQGACVGGTTVINSAIVVRTPGDITREWAREHGFDGNGDQLAQQIWAHQDAIEREIQVTPVPESAYGRSNTLAEAGARALGLHDHHMDRNVAACEGAGQCLQGCRKGHKRSLNLNYIPETVRRGGIVLSCAPVDRIRFEGRRAVGVTGRFRHPLNRQKGQRFEVRAKKAVVVAASATRSPVLLRRSGVRLPALGRYFRAHPGSGVFGIYDDPVDMNRGATQGWSSTHFRAAKGIKLEVLSLPPELVASRLAGAGPVLVDRLRSYRHMAMWCLSVRAESTGRVFAGPFGTPIVRYQMNARDMTLLREGAWHVARLHVAAGAKRVVPGVYGLPYTLDANDVNKILTASINPQAWTAILSHLFGGCVMGADPKRSVCDPTGAVRSHLGLYVVDASALPSTLGVNPQHTIMAMARIQAERMLANPSLTSRKAGRVLPFRRQLTA